MMNLGGQHESTVGLKQILKSRPELNWNTAAASQNWNEDDTMLTNLGSNLQLEEKNEKFYLA